MDDLLGTDDSLKKSGLILSSLSVIWHSFLLLIAEKFKLFWSQVNKMMLVEFLKKQMNLKDLKLNDGYGGEFFMLPGIFELKFSLKKCEFYCKPKPFASYRSLSF